MKGGSVPAWTAAPLLLALGLSACQQTGTTEPPVSVDPDARAATAPTPTSTPTPTPVPAPASSAHAADAGAMADTTPAQALPPVPALVEARWQCGDKQIAGRFDNGAGTLTLTHEHGQLLLPQAVSASGARYADGNGNELWVKGDAATLTRSGQAPRECQAVSAAPKQP